MTVEYAPIKNEQGKQSSKIAPPLTKYIKMPLEDASKQAPAYSGNSRQAKGFLPLDKGASPFPSPFLYSLSPSLRLLLHNDSDHAKRQPSVEGEKKRQPALSSSPHNERRMRRDSNRYLSAAARPSAPAQPASPEPVKKSSLLLGKRVLCHK